MRLVIFLYLSLAAVIVLGCGGRTAEDEGDPPAAKNEVPESARIVCDDDGAQVLTPRVEARSDGVHISLDNRLEGNVDFSVDHPGGGTGWSVPTGESERVANVPPGKVRVDCFKHSWGMSEALTIDSGTIEVMAGDSGYKSTKLDCPREKGGRIEPYTEEEMEEQKGDPVEIYRRSHADSLREDDVVEVAGNTQSQDEKTVRVVRDGKVVATAHYLEFSTGWLEATEENCAEF